MHMSDLLKCMYGTYHFQIMYVRLDLPLIRPDSYMLKILPRILSEILNSWKVWYVLITISEWSIKVLFHSIVYVVTVLLESIDQRI